MNTFSNANRISDNTKRLLLAMSTVTSPEDPKTAEKKTEPKIPQDRVPKILLSDAVKSGKFTYKGKGVYKEANTDTSIGRVWIKKEVIDDVTGEKQEWLVAYTNEEEDFARSLATKKLKMPKVLSGAGAVELIRSIEREGQPISQYPVDESQMVSNAGDAASYAYLGNKYEIVTWNQEAQEHTPGEQTISNLGPTPVQSKLQKKSYAPQEMGDMDMRNELRGEWELDEACPECGSPMEGTSDEMFHCVECNTSYDALDLEEQKMQGQESRNQFDSYTSQKKAYNDFGVEDLQRGHAEIDNKLQGIDMPTLEEGPTDNPFDVATSDEPAFDAGGTQIQLGSIVQNEFNKEGSVADILSPDKVTVSWFDKNYSEGERGDTIFPGDIRVVGAKDDKKVKRFLLSASNDKGDYCVVCKNGKKFAGEYGNINSPDTFNDPQLLETIKLGGKASVKRWFLSKLANKGLTIDRFHLGANPYVNAHEFAILTRSNGKTQHTLSKVAGRGIYSLYTEIEGDAVVQPQIGGNVIWMRNFTVPGGEDIYGTDKFLAYIEEVNGAIVAMVQTIDGQELSGDTFPNEFSAQKFIMAEVAAMKDNASVWSATASISASLRSLRKKAIAEGGEFGPESVGDEYTQNMNPDDLMAKYKDFFEGNDINSYNPDYSVSGEIIWSKPFTIEGGEQFYGTDRFVAYIEKTQDGYGAVIDEYDGQTVSGDTFADENEARKFLAAEIAAMKDNTTWWNTEAHISDSLRQLHKIAGQPKPEDIPIAPGIKSKNITIDESGGQGTANVTINFTDVNQGLKFYQENVGQPEAAPAPATTPAPQVEPKEETPAVPAPQAGPPTPVASSLNKKADEGGRYFPGSVEFIDDVFNKGNLKGTESQDQLIGYLRRFYGGSDIDTKFLLWQNWKNRKDQINRPIGSLNFANDEGDLGLVVGSLEWVRKTVQAADDHFSGAGVVPDSDDYIGFISSSIENETGIPDEDQELAVAYWRTYQGSL